MRHLSTSRLTGLVAAAALLAVAAPASADPRGLPVALDCGDGSVRTGVIAGRGEYTPTLIAGSKEVFKPVAFGDLTVTVYDAEGDPVFSETWPGSSQGSADAPRQGTLVTCSFEQVFTAEQDPYLEEGQTASFSGTVTGLLTPRRG